MGLDKQRRAAKQVTPTSWDNMATLWPFPPTLFRHDLWHGQRGYTAICMTQFAAKMYCKWLSARRALLSLATEADGNTPAEPGTTAAYSFGDNPRSSATTPEAPTTATRNTTSRQEEAQSWGPLRHARQTWPSGASINTIPTVTSIGRQAGGKPGDRRDKDVSAGGARRGVDRRGSLAPRAARRASSKDGKRQRPANPKERLVSHRRPIRGFRVVRRLRVPGPEEAARYELTDYEKREFLDYRRPSGKAVDKNDLACWGGS